MDETYSAEFFLELQGELLDYVMRSPRNAMVGTLRTQEQLQFCLSNKGYYVPSIYVSPEQLPIGYIALIEDVSEDRSVICRYGRVLSTHRLPRGRIPVSMRPNGNPEEVYYYFKVRQWVDLPHVIEFRDSVKGRPLFTTRFLLEQCRQSYELFAVSSPTDYCLMKALHKTMDCLREEDAPHCISVDRNNILSCANGAFVITNQKANTVYSVSMADFESNPRAAFSYLKRHL